MIRALSALFLSLALAVTSVTLALARGQAAGLTEVVICAGGAAVTVMVDAAGQPVEQVHHCPDCLVALDRPHPAPLARLAAPVLLARLAPVPDADAAPAPLVLSAPPRGPPVLS